MAKPLLSTGGIYKFLSLYTYFSILYSTIRKIFHNLIEGLKSMICFLNDLKNIFIKKMITFFGFIFKYLSFFYFYLIICTSAFGLQNISPNAIVDTALLNPDQFGQFVLENNINLNAIDDDVTPLIVAVQRQSIKAVRIMLKQKNIDINVENSHGKSAIYFAAKHSQKDIIELLLTQPSIDESLLSLSRQDSLIRMNIRRGDLRLLNFLVEHTNFDINRALSKDSRFKETPLSIALKASHYAIVRYLLDNPDLIDRQEKENDILKQDPFFLEYSLIIEAERNPEGFVSYLQKFDIDPSILSSKNFFPLIVAAKNGLSNATRVFLKFDNVDVNRVDYARRNALFYSLLNKHDDITQLLMEHMSINKSISKITQNSELIRAAFINFQTEVIKFILKYTDFDVNKKISLNSGERKTPLELLSQDHRGREVAMLLFEYPNLNISEYLRKMYLGQVDKVMVDRGYISEESEARNFILSETKKIKFNDGVNPLLSKPSSLLLVDSPISEYSYPALLTHGNYLLDRGPLNRVLPIKKEGTHGDLLTLALNVTGIEGLNFIDIMMEENLECSNHGNLLQILDRKKPNVVNISCGPDIKSLTIDKLRNLSDIAEKTKTYIVNAAGNEGFDISFEDQMSDYLFVVGATDNSGKLLNYSNYGSNVTFAAPAKNIVVPNSITNDFFDFITLDNGGTSYANGVVAGLITRIFNYLPLGSNHYPRFIKYVIKKYGNHSEDLVEKLESPNVVNPEKTIEFFKENIFFRYKKLENQVAILCDRRLKGIELGALAVTHSCREDQWINVTDQIKSNSFELKANSLPFYGFSKSVHCKISFSESFPSFLFPDNEGIVMCR